MARTYSLPTMRPARVGRGSLARRTDRGPTHVVDGSATFVQVARPTPPWSTTPPHARRLDRSLGGHPREEDGVKSMVGRRGGSHS